MLTQCPCRFASLSRRIIAFTLLELLVAMAITALLATLFLPLMSQAKARATAALCRNNLRQWGVATHVYALDHGDHLPPEGLPNPGDQHTNSGWYIQLPKILGIPAYQTMPWRTNPSVPPGSTVWLCPSNVRRSNGRNLFHYCLNRNVDGTSDSEVVVLLSMIPHPASTIWLFDTKNLPAVGSWSFVHTNLHQQGAHFLFLDGHAARFRNSAYWDFDAGEARTNNPDLLWIP